MIYYLIGQPGAGKTTIAKEMLIDNPDMFHIDGDDIRNLFDNKDYSRDGREKNITLAHLIAEYLHSKGKDVVISLVSPYKDLRDKLKEKYGNDIVEAHIHTDNIRGREQFFVKDYEKPTENYIDICTDNITVGECVTKILEIKKWKKYTSKEIPN
jgi:adenylylsulfate kinase